MHASAFERWAWLRGYFSPSSAPEMARSSRGIASSGRPFMRCTSPRLARCHGRPNRRPARSGAVFDALVDQWKRRIRVACREQGACLVVVGDYHVPGAAALQRDGTGFGTTSPGCVPLTELCVSVAKTRENIDCQRSACYRRLPFADLAARPLRRPRGIRWRARYRPATREACPSTKRTAESKFGSPTLSQDRAPQIHAQELARRFRRRCSRNMRTLGSRTGRSTGSDLDRRRSPPPRSTPPASAVSRPSRDRPSRGRCAGRSSQPLRPCRRANARRIRKAFATRPPSSLLARLKAALPALP